MQFHTLIISKALLNYEVESHGNKTDDLPMPK